MFSRASTREAARRWSQRRRAARQFCSTKKAAPLLGFGMVLVAFLVLVIIGLLASLVAPQLFGLREKANVDAARGQIHALHDACDLYRLLNRELP